MLLVAVGVSGVGTYNTLVAKKTDVEAAWSEINNQYKRRYDLVPQLVETVKGAADFEQAVLTEVTEARASVGKLQVGGEAPSDPAQLEQYLAAQKSLGGALSRLLVVAENYPQLTATEGFITLQGQLEGTENRIATARRDYIEGVRTYNTAVRSFPGNLMAGFFGFEESAQLEIEAEATERPKIDFGER
jgi:LemA protein